ncbi:MAG: hypothetical protein IJW24_00715 [Clostridia bacterium]|nr:hypothetical protein [Clostridia bacterium]
MNKKLKYRFKIYCSDGTSKFIGGRGATPESLKYDFDGMVSWDEYERISDDETMGTAEILNLAKTLYSKKHSFSRIEIVNTETGEVVDFIN